MNPTDLAPANHERFMRRCIELACMAREEGNTPVGSVVVLDRAIIGEGFEALPSGNSLTGHAEVLACQQAVDNTGSRQLDGATLYTTAEPCFMCSYVIRQSGIALVVYGIETPVIGGVTSTMPILTDEALLSWRIPPAVIGGVLASECRALRQK